jgi:DNA-binding NarL/FixJ family response regulator
MKILIIDNSQLYMESLFDLINKNFDIDIVGCESHEEGVEYLETASRKYTKIDVLFIDVKNDEILNSRPLLLANQYKKSTNPNLSIVLFSLADKTPLMQDAINIGYVDYFLPKYISTEDLKLFISNIRFLKYPF